MSILCYNYSRMKEYYVYIMSNKRGALYTGVTNNLLRRVYQHKNKLIQGFTKKYNITQLGYFENSDDISAAITREKQIKGMPRSKKIDLIKTMNPQMSDLRLVGLTTRRNLRDSPTSRFFVPRWFIRDYRGTPE